ncbi:MAG: purine-nucleoside phosphorylase [Acidobacteria bacterium]|nr:purine-nucleoside phosphorylase [Acidobacteriota bacterium]MCI0661097.1 purine-nucleoside phosphorylase [Acidobacteriota bacterium]
MAISVFDRAQASARYIREQIATDVDVAVVLGSGLGTFAETLENKVIIPYEEIPDFARSTVEGHSGRLVLGKLPLEPINIAVMQGRFHYYEGYSLEEVTLPIRAFCVMGVKKLVLTNAAGSINQNFNTGDFMLISDHINLMLASPLRGRHDQRMGERFPDMTMVYSREYRQIAQEVASELGMQLHAGVYMALQGPNYETPAEIRMMRMLGADAVGMSTVPEAIVARQMGMNVLGISLITNAAAGIEDGPINHDEVMEMGQRVSGEFCQLLTRIIARL